MEDRGQDADRPRHGERAGHSAGRTGHRMRPWEALLTQKQAQRLRDTKAVPFRGMEASMWLQREVASGRGGGAGGMLGASLCLSLA